LKVVVKEELILAYDMVENRPKHGVMTGLEFVLSGTVKELGHNSREARHTLVYCGEFNFVLELRVQPNLIIFNI
jgi:hypothetical protein